VDSSLDTGLRVSELAELTKNGILWQESRLMVSGKGGAFDNMILTRWTQGFLE
jgi:site-specific recombinase XerD